MIKYIGVKLNGFLVVWTNPVCPCMPLVTHNGLKTIGNATDSCPPLAGDQGGGLAEPEISAVS